MYANNLTLLKKKLKLSQSSSPVSIICAKTRRASKNLCNVFPIVVDRWLYS